MIEDISLEFSYHGYSQSPGTSWGLTANQQYLGVNQMGAKDTKEWALSIVSTSPITKPLGIEPLDLSLQELEADVEELQKGIQRLIELPHPDVGRFSRHLTHGYELNIFLSTIIEVKILPLRYRCMIEQLPSRIELFQRIRNKFI